MVLYFTETVPQYLPGQEFFVRLKDGTDKTIQGITAVTIAVASECFLAFALEVLNYTGYAVSIALLTNSFSPMSSWASMDASRRLGAAVGVLALRYFIQYLQGTTYLTTREIFITGYTSLHPAVLAVAEIGIALLGYKFIPLGSTKLAVLGVVSYLLFSRFSPLRYKDLSADWNKWKENHKAQVEYVQRAIVVTKIVLPILTMILYKTVGTKDFPYFFIAHISPLIIIPLTELERYFPPKKEAKPSSKDTSV